MRKILVTLVVLGLCSTLASANGIGVFGSWWKPKDLDDGFGGGAKVQLEVAPNLLVEARGTYFYDVKDKDDSDGTKLTIIPIEADGIIKFPLADSLAIYGGGGGGYYMFDVQDEPAGVDVEVENKVGFFAIAGVELKLSEDVALFGEGKYTWLKDVNVKEKVGGVTVGEDEGDLTGFGGNAGLLLLW